MQPWTYDTPAMLAFKYVIRTFVLAFKSQKDLFLASLLFNKPQVCCVWF